MSFYVVRLRSEDYGGGDDCGGGGGAGSDDRNAIRKKIFWS